ncbi:MAG TPA: hypothetical protein VMU87_08030 [Stellaceae bacterium]|nr:hypothetical protein [Stellaceae bacterium]
MGRLKPASLATMPAGRQMVEIGGKDGDITPVLLLCREVPPDEPLDPAVADAAAPLLVSDEIAPDLPRNSFFARCARRIKRFAEGQTRGSRAKDSGPGVE